MRTTFRVPGTTAVLEFDRDEQGRVTRVGCGPVEYFESPTPEDASYGGGFVRTTHLALPSALMRAVYANGERWNETYRWNDAKLMTEVDGVEIVHDNEQRVVACRGSSGSW